MKEKNGAQTPRVALATGGSRGLRRAFTDRLVRRGWHVVIDARGPLRLAEMARTPLSRHEFGDSTLFLPN